ncbi:cell wall anchor protein, partial [Pasteurellaceae bacterium LIM206]|nr:cell wall anchor protein [Pasteurellaceae bacterium LIM206]
MSITLKVLSAKKVVASHNIEQNQSIVIDSRDKSNYQLIDDQTGFAPQNIIAKRIGKDLQITLEDGNLTPDIVIKDYYGEGNTEEVTNLIVGQHENGKIYAYVPESGEKPDAVSMLDDTDAAPQALGGDELVSPFWVFNPWWLLALVPLAAIAVAAGSNGGGDSKDTTAPAAPDVDPKQDGSVEITPKDDSSKTTVDYTDESGNSKQIVAEKGKDGKWTITDPANNPDVTIDPNTGKITIPEKDIKGGTDVTA